MKLSDARAWLTRGLHALAAQATQWDRRQDYFEGRQDLPYRPPGVSIEYDILREQAVANFLDLVTSAPVQRMRAIGILTGDEQLDRRCMERWQANKMDARQAPVLAEMMTHGRGITSVWPNLVRRDRPIYRPESSRNVWLEPDPDDAWSTQYVVKRWTVTRPTSSAASALVLPTSLAAGQAVTKTVAVVYDAGGYQRWERAGDVEEFSGRWEHVGGGDHPFGRPPFVPTDMKLTAAGTPRSLLEQLMPQQDAVNTIRFFALLALQFGAHRQRLISGYDPVLRDGDGLPIWQTNPDGSLVTDRLTGQKVPMIQSPGRFAVDRAIVFPGVDTKVWDLDESSMDNYVTTLNSFLSQLFATAQAPPQYLLTQMANLSGDALAGAESTLTSLIGDLKQVAGEADEDVHALGAIAAGDTEVPPGAEMRWADAEAKSFSQIADGVAKLVGTLPRRARERMVPNASDRVVEQWDQWWTDEAAETAQTSPAATVAAALRDRAAARLTDQPTGAGGDGGAGG